MLLFRACQGSLHIIKHFLRDHSNRCSSQYDHLTVNRIMKRKRKKTTYTKNTQCKIVDFFFILSDCEYINASQMFISDTVQIRTQTTKI